MRGMYNDFFMQDDIQISRTITVNAGLRYQYDTAPRRPTAASPTSIPTAGLPDPVGSPVLDAPKTNFLPGLGSPGRLSGMTNRRFRSAYGIYFAVL